MCACLQRIAPDTRKGLLVPGLLSALVYLVAFTIPYWIGAHYPNVQDELFAFSAREPWRGVLFYLALAAEFALYLVAYRAVGNLSLGRRAAWVIGLLTLVFCLLLIPVQPVTSSDVYGYVFQGRIVSVLGENPFAHLYRDFQSDPFYFLVTFHNLPASTGYGPLWILIEAGLGALARDRLLLNLLLFKGLAASLHLVSAALVFKILEREAPDRSHSGLVFYAWNPLVLFEVVGNGHNDAAVAALSLLGFYLLIRQRWWAAVPSLTAAALVKPVAILWLPLAVLWLLGQTGTWPARIRRTALIGLLALLASAAAYGPFWVGAATFRGVVSQSDIYGNSLPGLLIQVLWSVWPNGRGAIIGAVKLLAVLAFAPFYVQRLWAARRELFGACYDVMLFYLLFVGFQFMPWYVTWLAVPAALLTGPGGVLRRRVTLLMSAAAPTLYFPFGWEWARRALGVGLIATLSALPVLGVVAWLALTYWRRPRTD